MDGYAQAIYAVDPPRRSKADIAEVTSLAVWLLPNFLTVVFAVTLLQVLFLSAGSPRLFHDSDTGWHVRNGEGILSGASVPRTDTFSYTRAGEPWFSWEWLSDAAFGASHRIAGLSGVALIAAAAIALTAYGTAHLTLSLGGNLFFTAAGTVLLLGVTSMHWLARPHVFSWVLALAFLSVAEHERCKSTRAIWALPAVAALWANMHPSFLLGPAILFIYAFGEWIARRNAGRFLAASLFSLLGTFINPYGWRLHEHVFAYLQSDYLMDHIEEFRSFSFHSVGALYVELFLAVAVLGTVALIRQRAFGPALLSLGMLHMSLYSARHLPTAAVLLLPLSIAALTREARARSASATARSRNSWPGLKRFLVYSDRLRAIDQRIYGIVPIALVLVLTLFGVNALANHGRVRFDAGTFPVHAADFLEKKRFEHHEAGRVFATDQWGGYLIYRFGGRLKVFIDGRSDFYGQNLLETYAQVTAIKPGWDRVLKQYDVQFVLVPPESPLASVLQLRADWKRVYSDSVSALYERAG
jgi:hypothetical protein